MPLTLHGTALSTSRVLVVLHELNLPYTHHPIDLASGAQKSAAHRKLQPFGKVPVLEDDRFFIYESRAICRYLVRKYPSSDIKLMPDESDHEAYGLFEQACSVEVCYFTPATETLGTELVIKPRSQPPLPSDPLAIARAKTALATVWAVYEPILAKQAYLTGDVISLVDLFHLPNTLACLAFGCAGMEEYPCVESWMGRLRERESWVSAEEVARG